MVPPGSDAPPLLLVTGGSGIVGTGVRTTLLPRFNETRRDLLTVADSGFRTPVGWPIRRIRSRVTPIGLRSLVGFSMSVRVPIRSVLILLRESRSVMVPSSSRRELSRSLPRSAGSGLDRGRAAGIRSLGFRRVGRTEVRETVRVEVPDEVVAEDPPEDRPLRPGRTTLLDVGTVDAERGRGATTVGVVVEAPPFREEGRTTGRACGRGVCGLTCGRGVCGLTCGRGVCGLTCGREVGRELGRGTWVPLPRDGTWPQISRGASTSASNISPIDSNRLGVGIVIGPPDLS